MRECQPLTLLFLAHTHSSSFKGQIQINYSNCKVLRQKHKWGRQYVTALGGGGSQGFCDAFVLKYWRWEKGIKNHLNLCDVIYERPLRPLTLLLKWKYKTIFEF